MLFWILLSIPLLIILVGLFFAWQAREVLIAWAALCGAAVMGGFICIPCVVSWTDQAADLGTLAAQDQVIAVYQQQVTSLQAELEGFHYQPGAMLNSDSPVAAVVKALTDVQGNLTDARVKKAQAIVNIERRRHGPMSGVITIVGDYPH